MAGRTSTPAAPRQRGCDGLGWRGQCRIDDIPDVPGAAVTGHEDHCRHPGTRWTVALQPHPAPAHIDRPSNIATPRRRRGQPGSAQREHAHAHHAQDRDAHASCPHTAPQRGTPHGLLCAPAVEHNTCQRSGQPAEITSVSTTGSRAVSTCGAATLSPDQHRSSLPPKPPSRATNEIAPDRLLAGLDGLNGQALTLVRREQS